jgi:hypothetical protein
MIFQKVNNHGKLLTLNDGTSKVGHIISGNSSCSRLGSGFKSPHTDRIRMGNQFYNGHFLCLIFGSMYDGVIPIYLVVFRKHVRKFFTCLLNLVQYHFLVL